MENKQLFEKQTDTYNPFFPLVRLEDIIETISDKSIQWILNNYNHIYVEYSESTAITRNKVPTLLRRTGLWISYNNGKEIITEYYKGSNNDVQNYIQWTIDDNWEQFDKIKHLDGSITYQHLSEALKQLMVGGNNINNFPDEEDLTTNGVVLSLKDREYEPHNFSGLGRIILRKNIIASKEGNSKNILTQNMINKANTIYEIRYNFDLNGAEITIPESCILDFQGGSLNNGKINGNNCELVGSVNIPLSLHSDGNFKNRIWNLEDFNAPRNPNKTENISCVKYLQHCVDFIPSVSVINVQANNYYIDATINVNKTLTIIGEGNSNYHGCHFYNFDSVEPITFFNVTNHYCTFENLSIKASTADRDYENYSHTCFKIGVDSEPIDMTTLINVSMFGFDTCVLLKANNTVIKNTGFSHSVFGIVFDTYTNQSYQRNVTISECRFHSAVVCVKFNTYWHAVTINHCDVNNVSCLVLDINGNSNIISNNSIFNPESRTVKGILYDYIINNSLSRITVSANNVHVAGDSKVGFFKGTGILTGNTIQRCELPTILGDYCICSNNNFYSCGSEDENNAAIVITKQTSIVTDNVVQAISTSNFVVGIKIQGVSPVCRNNNIFGYKTPIKGVNAEDTQLANYLIKSIELFNNKGFDDRQYQSTLNESFNGCTSYDANWDPIHWVNDRWVYNDGAKVGIVRVGNPDAKPTGEKIYRGFQYFDIESSIPVYAKRIDGEDVEWVDSNGYTLSNKYGETNKRPVFKLYTNHGFIFYDNSLNKPIWWTGEKWIDATGADV